MNVANITAISGTNTAGTWTPQQGVRSSTLYSANPNFPRLFRMDNQVVVITAPGVPNGVAYPLVEILKQAISVNAALTYTPKITSNPANVIQANTAAAGFQIAASAETSINYQWQLSINSGFSWSNLAAAGVYANVTTNTLNISNVSGLTGNLYRCLAVNATGASNSASASLTAVHDPSVIVDPASQQVAHPYGADMKITAVGASALTYKWQNSTDGTNFSNMSDTGVYSGSGTNTLVISSVTGLNLNYFRCFVSDSASNVTSNAAVLTVT